MVSGEQYYPPSPVPYDQDAFLGALGLSEIDKLEMNFSPKDMEWRVAFQKERLTRQKDIEEMRLYMPPLEAPPYDAEAGPTAYLNQIRRQNHVTTVVHESSVLRTEKKHLHTVAENYVNGNYHALQEALRGGPRLNAEELTEFLESNLRALFLLPPMIAVRSLRAKKLDAVLQFMPLQINHASIRYHSRSENITRAQIASAKEAVMALRMTTPFPDFFQMLPEDQAVVVDALGAELRDLCKLLVRYDRASLGVRQGRVDAALSFYPVARLQSAIEQYPSVDPGKICQLFTRRPRQFESALKKAAVEAERQKKYLEDLEAQRQELIQKHAAEINPAERETKGMVENMIEIQRLTDDPDVVDAFLDAPYGEEVALTGRDELLIGPKFDEIAAKHTELVGRAIWVAMADKSESGVRFGQHGNFSVGSALRGKHRGNMRNLTVKRVPVTAEEMAAELKNYNPLTMLPENAVRLIFLAEIKPTGRKPEQTYLSMILTVTQSPKGRDIIEMNRHAAKATGPAVALSLRMDAEARARAVELGAWKAPAIRVGLPSLGRGGETSTQQK